MFLRLSCEGALSCVAMPFAFAVLLVGILDGDFAVHEILAIHIRNGIV
jgi:hypothetical protein